MESGILQSRRRAFSVRPGKAGGSALFLLTSVLLCEPAAADPVAPPGSITYMREVPLRRADQPAPPGDAYYVRTAPTEVIFGALGQAITPLTDEEAGAISAQAGAITNSALGTVLDNVHNVLGVSGGNGSAQLDPNAMASNFTGAVTGAIGNATSAIQGAIGSLMSVLPSKPQ